MSKSTTMLDDLSRNYQAIYSQNKVILTFSQFLDLVRAEPRRYLRNSAQYLLDTFSHFGQVEQQRNKLETPLRFSLFDLGTERGGPIIGGESAQAELYNIIQSFTRGGFASKLILLHGPNGSAKSSTVETIANAMQEYSQTEAGAVYRFNWIFPSDKDALPHSQGESSPIGFGTSSPGANSLRESFALLDDSKISSKIISEFKENPIFLLPMPYREEWLRRWQGEADDLPPADVELPPHILTSSLSKKNQQIFENLLTGYNGDLSKVYRHIQVERFFYSRQYRVGISTIEPQMSVDAHEKQLTLDKNYSNLPAVLHTISFYQSAGELIEANRGILEFSDLLKRPVEAFKYLLGTIERGSINLSSGTAHLDIVFVGTTNEKHLDAFKTIPDFSSFKGRFELITVPYLLISAQESDIYRSDIKAIAKSKPIAPHTVSLLCRWSVMTRLKQPDPEHYPKDYRTLIARLDPYSKSLLYEGKPLQPHFTLEEEHSLREIVEKIWKESHGMVVYEGRFGASPREIRALLHRAAQNPQHKTLTPMTIFEELKNLTKDRTVYEFLQFEPRGQYHDASLFIDILKREFLNVFESEVIAAMTIADEQEYDSLLRRYVDHVVAEIKKERIWDETISSYSPPSQSIMNQVENILDIKKPKEEHRANLLSRIAAYKLDNPSLGIDVGLVFHDYLLRIKKHFYSDKKKIINHNYKMMLLYINGDISGIRDDELKQADATFAELERRFHYDRESAYRCLQFLLASRPPSDLTS